jgi:hypothetical protein
MSIKKNISVLLMLLLTLPMLVSLCIEVKIKWVQHEVLEKMEQTHLHVIKVDSNQVQWKIKNKELIIGDQLFDVKYAVYEGGKINFYGLFDREEARLENIIEKNMSGNESSKEIKKITRFLLQLQFLKTHTTQCFVEPESKQLDFIAKKIGIAPNPFLNIITLPPNLFFL